MGRKGKKERKPHLRVWSTFICRMGKENEERRVKEGKGRAFAFSTASLAAPVDA
jgi:hypothetical protein